VRRAGSAVAAGALALGAAWLAWPEPPAFEAVRAAHVPSEAQLLDRAGRVLHERRADARERRLAWTPLAEVSPALVPALLHVEDRRFFAHAGVDLRALGGAALAALRGERRGASTLTMQLAAQLDPALRKPSGGRSLGQKLRQAAAAIGVEARWSKEEILEAYLNGVSFRGELVGVRTAAQGLFGRAPDALGEDEAWLLAALLRAPGAAPATVAARACRLSAAEPGTCERLHALAGRALGSAPALRPPIAEAPHLAARLLSGDERLARTTLDRTIQHLANEALRAQLVELAPRNVRDGAVLVADNGTGDVLAWVGSSGPLSRAPHVDFVRARRQAGSTLKPFVYAAAFDERRLGPGTRLDDAPLELPTGAGSYRPENYDRRFHGPVSARLALGSSLNVPAVRALELVGVPSLVRRLRALGFGGLAHADLYGPSLALGAADVSLLELVTAYRALARGGVAGVLRVRADEAVAPDARVLSPEATFLVADVLSDRGSRSLTFGLESSLATRHWSAVKTGTSKDMRDNWCIGFSRRYTVGVWVGNGSGEPMWDVSGMDGAAPVWVQLMEALHADDPGAPPKPPPGLVRAASEWWIAGTEPPPELDAASPPLARIVSPAPDQLVALDPDIPPTRERMLLRAEPADAALGWRLDGEPLGSAAAPVLWAPVRGRHELVLVDAEGRAVDAVRFVVR
jgi:penicillin-binding protein 1C